MDYKHNRRRSFLQRTAATAAALVLCLWPSLGKGQTFVSCNPPTEICAGESRTIHFGYNRNFEIVIDAPQTSHNHAERVFLPDGQQCGSYGCSYRSPINFTDFEPGATVSSAEDIKYVRLKIEHSYIGDLYINITCPNGQKASLLNFSGEGTSSCTYTIPSSHRGWSAGNNISTGAFLGMPVDEASPTNPCSTTDYRNRPGVGWNYCWSSNSTSGYQYASGDGKIYRNRPTVGSSIDSSNVSLHRNFYRPEQSFARLAGCPLNGNWYIEVLDGWSGDNGYLFEWELALDPTLTPSHCALEERRILSPYITRLNDSTYTLLAPNNIHRDTTVLITYRMINTCGETVDSIVPLIIHPTYNLTLRDTVCDRYTLFGRQLTESTSLDTTLRSSDGCDSTMHYRLTIYHSERIFVRDTVVENSLPYLFGDTQIDHPVSDTLIYRSNNEGCDSVTSLSLHVWYNQHVSTDSTICRHQLPLLWNSHLFEEASTASATLLDIHGADSVIDMTLYVKEDTDSNVFDTVVENSLPRLVEGHENLFHAGNYEYRMTNSVGCDSILRYHLHVWQNCEQTFDTLVCDHGQWPTVWKGVPFYGTTDTTLLLSTSHGADSTVHLSLLAAPIYDTALSIEACANHGYLLADSLITTDGEYQHMFYSLLGCDSLVRLSVKIWPTATTMLQDTICRTQMPFTWAGYTFEYNNELFQSIHAQLQTTHGCDSNVTLNLFIQGEFLKARAHITPQVVSEENLKIEIADNSRASSWRHWTIGEYETDLAQFVYEYPAEEDSVEAVLVAGNGEGCTDTAVTLLQIDRSIIIAPNVFTPNLEHNKTWFLLTKDISDLEIWIYNREGFLVWHHIGTDGEWDGKTMDGKKCVQGAYVYKATYRSRVHPERENEKVGSILLIR